MSALAALPESPYRGLTPFGESELDAVLFFGRDREREVIVANLMASRLTLLYGPSGVGKSSLLRAGVAYHLRGLAAENVARGEPPQLAVVLFSRWSDEPTAGIAGAAADEVERLTGERPGVSDDADLAEALDICAAAVGGEVYVMLDQFEEYFIYRNRRNDRADRFAAQFADAVDRREVRAHFVISLREDELARLDAFKASIPGVFGNFLRLDRLDRRAAREAIEGPLRAWNGMAADPMTIEAGLVEAVLDEVSVGRIATAGGSGNGSATHDAARIEAPYLQLVMQRVWEAERAAGSSVLRAETLATLGGAQQIVGEHLERALASLEPDEKDAAARMFTYLVTPSGSKIAHAPGDLADYAGIDERRAAAVLGALAAQRIVRPVETAGGDGARYEIFHDVLGDTVMAWRAAYVAERRLEQEREAARRRQRQLLSVALAALLALAVVGSIALYALNQRSEAGNQARKAAARELVVSSQSRLETDPELSMLLALEAAKRERTPAVAGALRRALIRSKALQAIRFDTPVLAAAFVPGGVGVVTADGRLRVPGASRRLLDGADVAAFDAKGRRVAVARGKATAVFDVRTGRVLRRLRSGGTVVRLALDTGSVAVTDRAGGVDVAPLAGGPAFHVDVKTAATAVAVRERRLAVASQRVVRLFAVGRKERLAKFVNRATVTAVAFSPDGASLATAAADGGVRTWDEQGRLTNVLGAFGARGTAIAYTPDGARVVSGFDTGKASLRRASDARDLGVYIGHRDRIETVDVTGDGLRAVTASRDGTVRVWDALGDQRLVVRQRLRRTPVALAWHGEGPVAVFDEARDPRIDRRARVVGADVRLASGVVLRGAGESLNSLRFARDGRRAVTANGLGRVTIWDTRRGTAVGLPLLHQAPVADASLSPDGRFVATAAPKTVYLWDMSDAGSDEPITLLVGHTDILVSAIFSPDGSTIASAARDKTIRTYRCDICGGLETLMTKARAQLALTGRRFKAAETAKYLRD